MLADWALACAVCTVWCAQAWSAQGASSIHGADCASICAVLCCAVCRRGQLKALVDIHGAEEGLGGNLTEDEIKVICGALDLTSKTARK
jgi:hypothetical protein